MGMGYAPASAVVITIEEIQKLELNTFKKLEDYLVNNEVSLIEVYDYIQTYDTSTETETNEGMATQLVKNFMKQFKKIHGVGIRPYYHDQEVDGSLYDSVNDWFFILNDEDLYEPTLTNKLLREKVNFSYESWVEFG